MKKLLLLLFLVFNSFLSFSVMKDKLEIKYAFGCKNCNVLTKEECQKHKNSIYKAYLLENTNTLLNEFKWNEPRALHNYHKNTTFFMKGTIEKLSSGPFNDDFIINLKDGTTIYILETEQEEYYNLNTGEEVYLWTELPEMFFSELKFNRGVIITEEDYKRVSKMIEDI